MPDDAGINITTSVDAPSPVPGETLESYLDYLEKSVLGAFLHARGYRHDPARAHLRGGQMAVLKDLAL